MGYSRRLWKDEQGNFAIMASIVSLPLLLTVGLAVDYYNVSRIRAELQSSIDSAVLAVAHEGENISDTAATAIADKFLRENFSGEFSNLAVSVSGTNVSVSADASVDLAFGGILGQRSIELSRSATSAISYANYEIALVLDTTGSMAGGKLAALKDAVGGLIRFHVGAGDADRWIEVCTGAVFQQGQCRRAVRARL